MSNKELLYSKPAAKRTSYSKGSTIRSASSGAHQQAISNVGKQQQPPIEKSGNYSETLHSSSSTIRQHLTSSHNNGATSYQDNQLTNTNLSNATPLQGLAQMVNARSANNTLSSSDQMRKENTNYISPTKLKTNGSTNKQLEEQRAKANLGEGYQSDDEESGAAEYSSGSSESDDESDENDAERQLKDRDNCETFYSEQNQSQFSDGGTKQSQDGNTGAIQIKNLPPPNQLLPKTILPDEPVRSGFVRKYIDIKKAKKFEIERAPQGVIKNQDKITTNVGIDNTNNQVTKNDTTTNEDANPTSETSLRHFFYLEYRKITIPSEKNPIVYSKFGKEFYESDEKFNSENFSQLLRTCNLKQLIKGMPGDTNYNYRTQAYLNTNNQIKGTSYTLTEYIKNKESNELYNPRKQYAQVPAPQRSYYIPSGPSDNTLVFESRFETGNLQLVHKSSDSEYNLILQNDINSKGHTQWFYFRVQNTRKGARVKFNFLNFIKPKSLYNEGMKVLIHSEKKFEQQDIGWFRGGEDISYYQNNYRREHMTTYQRCYYSFTFSYQFEHDQDTLLFAYSQPYTYSDLTDDITNIIKQKYDFITRNTLCRTLAGNKCEYLTITSRRNSATNPNGTIKQKKGVILTGRIHPGESNSSWMMKGIIDFLVSDSVEAEILRNNFVFKIVPMLNPDGVINGNYRCSLAGCDLNRRWKNPSQVLHPTIYYTKQLAKEFGSERPIALYCDLHGHSRRKNVFMYGNYDPSCPEATKVFPFIMSKIAKPHFSYDYSRFKVQRSKESTARITMWKELKIPNVFTMEASFCGPKAVRTAPLTGQNESTPEDLNYHFTAEDLMNIGKNLCQTLLIYSGDNININDQISDVKNYHNLKLHQGIPNHPNTTNNSGILSPKNEFSTLNQKLPSGGPPLRKQLSEKINPAPQQQSTLQNQGSNSALNSQSLTSLNSENLVSDKFSKSELMNELSKKIKEEKSKPSIQEVDNESSSCSDSVDSEDNLEAEELIKLMPKRTSKKKPGQNKKKKLLQQNTNPQPKRKEELVENKKPTQGEVVDSKRKHSQVPRGAFDLRKPTQSYLSKYNMMGKQPRVFNALKMKDALTQTSDNDSDYELSAMEKDIYRVTGVTPTKIRKMRQRQQLNDDIGAPHNNEQQEHRRTYADDNNCENGNTKSASSSLMASQNLSSRKMKENVQVLVSKQGLTSGNNTQLNYNDINQKQMYNSACKPRGRFGDIILTDSSNNRLHQQQQQQQYQLHGQSFETTGSQPTLSHCGIQYDSLRLDSTNNIIMPPPVKGSGFHHQLTDTDFHQPHQYTYYQQMSMHQSDQENNKASYKPKGYSASKEATMSRLQRKKSQQQHQQKTRQSMQAQQMVNALSIGGSGSESGTASSGGPSKVTSLPQMQTNNTSYQQKQASPMIQLTNQIPQPHHHHYQGSGNNHRVPKGIRISEGQALEKIIEKPPGGGRSLSTNSNIQQYKAQSQPPMANGQNYKQGTKGGVSSAFDQLKNNQNIQNITNSNRKQFLGQNQQYNGGIIPKQQYQGHKQNTRGVTENSYTNQNSQNQVLDMMTVNSALGKQK